MTKFGFSGIWEHPQTTIPALILGIGGVVVALGWCDATTWERWATIAGPAVISIIGILYKGPTQ